MRNFYLKFLPCIVFSFVALFVHSEAKAQASVIFTVTNSCGTSDNGSIAFTVTGVAPLSIRLIGINEGTIINQSATSGVPVTISSLPDDSYLIIVFDGDPAPNYSNSTVVTSVTPISGINTTVVNNSDQTCLTPNGSITINSVTGGSGSYSYSWTGSGGFTSTSQNISSLKGGTYSVNITDQGANCTFSSSPFTITDPLPSTFTISSPDVFLCNGENLVVDINPATPTNGIQYTLYDGATAIGTTVTWPTSQIVYSGLSTGLHSNIRVEGKLTGSICTPIFSTNTLSVNVSTPPTVATLTLAGATPICAGQNSSIQANITGGTAPYSFTVTGLGAVAGYNGSPITVTPAATTTYSFGSVITDNSGCTVAGTGSFQIVVNPLPTVVISGGGPVCASDPLPTVTFTFTGTAPFNFTYTDGTTPVTVTGHNSTTFTISTAPVGTYSVTALSDANTCAATTFGTPIAVSVNPLPTASASGGATICANALPTITFTFTGTAPFNFTYTDGTTPVSVTAHNSTTFTIPNAPAGTYSITALTDANGCVATSFGTAQTVIVNPLPTVVISGGGVVCASDPLPAVTFTFTGTAPFNFTYTDGTTPVTVTAHNSTTYTIPTAPAGTYSVTALSDANTCAATTFGIPVAVTVNPLPTANASGGTTVCAGSLPTVTFTFTGTAPFNFTYTDGTTPVSVTAHNSTTFSISNAPAGTYSVTALTDASTCAATNFGASTTVIVNPLPTAVVSGGGPVCAGSPLPDVTFTFTGTAPFDFTYTDGTTPVTILGHPSTTYTISAAPVGTYSITALNDATSCPATSLGGSTTVSTNTLPTASVSGGGTVCASAPLPTVTFTFTGTAPFNFTYTDGTMPVVVTGHNSTTFSIITAPAGTYSVTALSDVGGCSATSFGTAVSVIVNPSPDVVISGGGPVCSGNPQPDVIFTFTGTAPFDFTYTDGTTPVTISGHPSTTYTISAAPVGTYSITAFNDATSCTALSFGTPVGVSNQVLPTAVVSGGGTVCSSAPLPTVTFTFTGTAPFNFTYTDGTTPVVVTGHNSTTFSIPTAPAGSYSVTALSDANCTGTSFSTAVDVIVNPSPDVVISGGGPVCTGSPQPDVIFTFTGTAPFDFTYTDGTTPVTVTAHPTTTYTITAAPVGTYSITAFNDATSCTALSFGTPVGVSNQVLPTAVVSGGGTVCASDPLPTVTFTFTGTAPFNFTYTDGTTPVVVTGHNSTTFSIITAPAGTYSVTALSDVGGCSATSFGTAVSVIVNPSPDVVISGGGPVCSGNPQPDVIFTFTGTAPFDFTYTDGTTPVTISGHPSTTYTISAAPVGTYSITAFNDATSCTALSFGTPVGVSNQVLPTAVVSGGGTVCSSAPLPTVTFTFTGTAPFNFTYTDGTTPVVVTGHNSTTFSIPTAPAGSYSVTALSDANCTGTSFSTAVDVIVNPSPDVVISGGGPVCTGSPQPDVIFTFTGTAPFDFTYTDGTTPVTVTAHPTTTYTITAAPVGTYSITAFNDATSCTALSFGTPVGVSNQVLPTAVVSGGGTVCASDPLPTVTFTFTGTAPFNFTYTDGTTPVAVTGHNSITFSIPTAPAGSYSVTALSDANCTGTSFGTAVGVIVNPSPSAPSITFDPTPICIGSAITAPVVNSPVGTSTYTWYSDAALTTVLTTSTAPTNTQLGFSSAAANVTTVYVTETSTNGCEGTATSVTLSVSDVPTASISGTATVCAGTSTTITLNLTGIQPWDVVYTDGTTSFPINGIATSTFTFSVSPLTTTTYSLVLVSNTACGAGTVSGSASITVNPIMGDQVTFGTDTWIGYAYTDAASPGTVDFASTKYRGFIDEGDIAGFGTSTYTTATDAFDLNFSNAVPLAGTDICGSYLDNYSIRFKMRKTFAAGAYTFSLSSDDGVRLFVDGSAVALAPNGSFNTHPYITYSSAVQCLSAGAHDLVIEYYERGGFARATFSYTFSTAPTVATITPGSACVNGTAPTLTATSADPGVTGFNWYTDATLLNKVATTAAYTPSATELDLTTANITTFYATATFACGEGLSTAVVVNVINSVNTTLTATPTIDPVCSGGVSGIKITTSESGVSYQLRDDSNNSLVGIVVTGTGGDIILPTNALAVTTTFNILASAGSCSGVLATKPTVNVSGTVNAGLTVTSASPSVCTGTATTIQIANSESGVTYQLRNDADDSLIGTPVAGTGLAPAILLSTGNLSTLPSVTFNILASNGTCSIELTTLITIGVDSNPDISLVVDSDVTGTLCVGGSAFITVANSEAGVSYQLRDDSNNSPIGTPVSGDGNKINLPTGVLSVTTTFNVLATSGACTPVELTATKTITVSGAIALNLSVDAVDPSVCSGSGTTIDVSASEVGVTYQLRNDADDSLIGAAVAGNGGIVPLPTGNLTTLPSITFNVLASSITCSAELSNKVTVIVGSNPNPALAVTVPPATLCVNGSTSVTVVSSETGVSYQLRNDADDSLIGSAVAGTGADILLPTGNLAATITFNVLASSGACTPVQMNTTVSVTVSGTIAANLAVTAHASPVCSGTATTIDVSNSDPLVNYQLRNNATNALIGTALAGNGATLLLPTGNLSATTTFNVLASNGTCSVQLTATASVTVTAAPVASLGVTAQNPTVCANTGTNIQVANSNPLVSYQLRNNATNALIGTALAGNGGILSLPTGNLTINTAFNILASVGTCSVQLTATASVTVLASTDPLCGGTGTGNCATVVITPVPTPAQCTLSNGAINFVINPAVPVVNNTGVKITITGISTTNSTIARTNFNNPSFPALPIGVYNYTIEYGDVSCLKTGQVTIDRSGTVGTPTATNVTGPTCAGQPTGSVTLDVPGETGNVLEWSLDGVLWNSFTAGNQITGIPAGVAPAYQRVISVRRNSTDPCNAAVTITIQDQFTPITATITPQQAATCNNNDGSVLVAYSGGDATVYKFELDGLSFTMPTDKIIRNLSGGNHILKVIDNQLCSITLSGTQFAVASPGLIQFTNVTVANPSCIGNGEDGMITVEFPTGSNEVAITQDADRSTPVFKDVPTNGVVEYKNLAKGRYYVTVKSKINGCPNERAIDILGGPSRISFTQEMTCEQGNPVLKLSDINVASGSFEIQITKLGDTTPDVITLAGTPAGGIYYVRDGELPLATGDYEIKIVQMQGSCSISSAVSRYTNNGALVVSTANILPSYSDIATGAFDLVSFGGGTKPYFASIRFDSAANPINETGFETDMEEVTNLNSTFGYVKHYNKLHAGRYHVTVEETGGCKVEFDVRVPLDFTFSINAIPNIFTPNGDGVNDFFYIRNLPSDSQLIISNRWGNEVYSSKSYQNDWNGGATVDGIYYYRLKAGGDTLTGWIEILRGK